MRSLKSWFCAAAPPTFTSTPGSVVAGPFGARSRLTSTAASSLSGPSLGVTLISTACPSDEVVGLETAATPGSCWTAWRYFSTAAASGARSPPSATTSTGPRAPGPAACAACSKPMRVSLSLGSCARAPVPHFSDSAGIAITSIAAVASEAKSTGRPMSRAVQRSQNGGRSSCTRAGRRPESLPRTQLTPRPGS